MTPRKPPALATWLLTRAARGNDALIGDLLEEFRSGRSRPWYWSQTLRALATTRWQEAVLAIAIVGLYTLGSYVLLPGTSASLLALMQGRAEGTPFRLFSIFSGGQLTGVTVFALGILPYISAAFLVQAIALVWNFFNRAAPTPRPFPIVMGTWLVAIVLCVTQAVGLAIFLERVSLVGGSAIVQYPGWRFRLTSIITLTAGSIVLMLISDQISKRRLGNGMMWVYLAGIATAVPGIFWPLLTGRIDPVGVLSMLTFNTAIAAIVAHGYRRAIVRELSA